MDALVKRAEDQKPGQLSSQLEAHPPVRMNAWIVDTHGTRRVSGAVADGREWGTQRIRV